MSGAPGLPEERTLKAFIRRELERLTLHNHHREELREARARWRYAIEGGVDGRRRDLDSSPPTD